MEANPGLEAAAQSSARCIECGVVFPTENMIRHGGAHVCANCKPVFLQKLAEGAEIRTGGLRFAGVGLRFAAVFVDGLIVGAINILLGVLAGIPIIDAAGYGESTSMLLRIVLSVAMPASYEILLIGKYGATFGKMACKIRVVTADGGSVSYLRALGRYLAKLLSAFTLMIGYIIAAFDPEKRTLHDRICNTRVVLK